MSEFCGFNAKTPGRSKVVSSRELSWSVGSLKVQGENQPIMWVHLPGCVCVFVERWLLWTVSVFLCFYTSIYKFDHLRHTGAQDRCRHHVSNINVQKFATLRHARSSAVKLGNGRLFVLRESVRQCNCLMQSFGQSLLWCTARYAVD